MCTRSDYGRERDRSQFAAQKKFGPRVRVGQRQRGPSSTPFDEEGFIYGAYGRQKGVSVRILSKNVSKQLQSMNGGQPANTCKHVFELKGFGKKAIRSGIDARLADIGFSV